MVDADGVALKGDRPERVREEDGVSAVVPIAAVVDVDDSVDVLSLLDLTVDPLPGVLSDLSTLEVLGISFLVVESIRIGADGGWESSLVMTAAENWAISEVATRVFCSEYPSIKCLYVAVLSCTGAHAVLSIDGLE